MMRYSIVTILLIFIIGIDAYSTLPYSNNNIQYAINVPDKVTKLTSLPFNLDQIKISRLDNFTSQDNHTYTLKVNTLNGFLLCKDSYPGVWINHEHGFTEMKGQIHDIQSMLNAGYIEYTQLDWIDNDIIKLYLMNIFHDVISSASYSLQIFDYSNIHIEIVPDYLNIMEDEVVQFSNSSIALNVTGVPKHHNIKCSLRTTSKGILSKYTINGTIDTITNDFSNLIYRPPKDYNGVDSILVSCLSDSKKQEISETYLDVVVHPVLDHYEMRIPLKSFTLKEDETIKLGVATGFYVLDTNAYGTGDDLIVVVLTISSPGLFHLPRHSLLGGLISPEDASSKLYLAGPINRVNMALQDVLITFKDNWYGKGSLHLRMIPYDGTFKEVQNFILDKKMDDFHQFIHEEVTFVVENVNDRPDIIIDKSKVFELQEGGKVMMSDVIHNITDIDSSGTEYYTLSLSLCSSHAGRDIGHFELYGNSGFEKTQLTHPFEDGHLDHQSRSSNVTFGGTLFDINILLHSLQLRLSDKWFGKMSNCLTVVVTDSHNATSLSQLSIYVSPVPEKPYFLLSVNTILSQEDVEILLSNFLQISLHDDDIIDSDTNDSFEISICTLNGGYILIPQYIQGLAFTQDGDNSDNSSTISFRGNLHVVNEALESLVYIPPPDLDSFDEITFNAIDSQFLVNSAKLHINLKPVDDDPVIKGPTLDVGVNHSKPIISVRGLNIIDVDSTEDYMDLNIRIYPNGFSKISFPRAKGIDVEFVFENDQQDDLIISGRLVDLNFVLEEFIVESLTYPLEPLVMVILIGDESNSAIKNEFIIYTPSETPLPEIGLLSNDLLFPEDFRIHLGSILSLADNHGIMSDAIFELSFLTVGIKVLEPIDLTINTSKFCSMNHNFVSFTINVLNERTAPLRTNATADDIQKALFALSNINDAKVKTNEINRRSFHIRLLIYDYQERLNPTNEDISLTVHRSESSQLDLCDANFTLNVVKQRQKEKYFVENWRMPFASLKPGSFYLGDRSFGTIRLYGNMQSLNETLKNVYFQPTADFHGRLKIHSVIKAVNTSYSTGNYIKSSFELRLQSVDDEPKLLWDDSVIWDEEIVVDVDEDSFKNVGGRLNVEDIDCSSDISYISIKCDYGTICFTPKFQQDPSSEINQNQQQCAVEGESLNIEGTLKEVNKRLSDLEYKPRINWSGWDSLSIEVQSNEVSVEKRMLFKVKPKNDHIDLFTLDEIYHVYEDSFLHIQGIYIDNVDCMIADKEEHFHDNRERCFFLVTVESINGRFIMRDEKVPSLILSLKGDFFRVNALLKDIIYIPNLNYNGIDNILIKVRRTYDGYEITKSMMIYVIGVNDTPIITFPGYDGYVVTIFEDYEVVIGSCNGNTFLNSTKSLGPSFVCEPIRINDDDNILSLDERENNGEMTLKLFSATLKFKLEVKSDGPFDNVYVDKLEIHGTKSDLNHALRGLMIRGDRDFHSVDGGLEILEITVEDAMGASISDVMMVQILPVNDSPELVISMDQLQLNGDSYGPMFLNEDETINVLGISVRDVDYVTNSGLLEIDIHVSHGTIIIHEGAQINAWLNDAVGKYVSSISFQGGIDEVNNILKKLVYKPNDDFVGTDSIDIYASDLGNHGVGTNKNGTAQNIDAELRHSISISLIVMAKVDPPDIVVPTFLITKEDTPLSLSAFVTHADSEETIIFVSISCEHGELILDDNWNQLKIERYSTQEEFSLSGYGSVSEWNSILSRIIYVPHENFDSYEKIIYSARNANESEESSKRWFTYIEVTPINDAPEISVPGLHKVLLGKGGYVVESVDTIVGDEDNKISITPVSVIDVDLTKDNYSRKYFVTISIYTEGNGQIKISPNMINFIDRDDAGHFMIFTAPIHICNEAIKILEYYPLPHYFGRDSITITITDNGNIGEPSIKLSSSVTIPILIKAVPDIPKVILTSPVQICKHEQWCLVTDVSVEDPDINHNLTLQISSSGSLFLDTSLENEAKVIKIVKSDSSYGSVYKLSGSADAINAVLETLAYYSSPTDNHNQSLDSINFLIAANELQSDTEMLVFIVGDENSYDDIRNLSASNGYLAE